MEIASHYTGIKSVVVANGVDTDRFRPDSEVRNRLREDESLNERDIVSLFVGGDWDRKGLELALDATALGRTRGCRLWLWVVGAGDSRRFMRLAARAGIAEWVRFFGPRSDVECFYQAADIFLLPTKYETFSMACYEAAASGLPIISTRVNGVSELIGAGEAGIIVDRDAVVICDALSRLARDSETRYSLGVNARLRAGAYRWQESAATVFLLYEALSEPHEGIVRVSKADSARP
jgi:UDP-glucose:(heptosyl)LPS alpha-1,3-glucosyltransferase